MLIIFICNLELNLVHIEMAFIHILELVFGDTAHLASCPNISMTIIFTIQVYWV